jgi:hypothetical protein
MLAALLHDTERNVGMRSYHYAIDCNGDSGQVRVGFHAFHLRRVWVDREDLISAILQPVVNSVGRLARGTGNTGHRKALSTKKLGD